MIGSRATLAPAQYGPVELTVISLRDPLIAKLGSEPRSRVEQARGRLEPRPVRGFELLPQEVQE